MIISHEYNLLSDRQKLAIKQLDIGQFFGSLVLFGLAWPPLRLLRVDGGNQTEKVIIY